VLPVVQSIVGAHGGTVHADSEVGCGTTFTVRLPRRR
jgi:signal transduction histidine kinase